MVDQTFEIDDSSIYKRICGQNDGNIHMLESLLGVEIIPRGNTLIVRGENDHCDKTIQALHVMADLIHTREAAYELSEFDLRYLATGIKEGRKVRPDDINSLKITINETNKVIVPRTMNQARYVSAIHGSDVTFGIGPAGTGKTYLAVALALHFFLRGKVERIVLTRPAVEAGESLGFLPGDLIQKINPYLRPLYDALFEFIGIEKVSKLIELGKIEIAPLAYMRGRTLNNSFIILDEAQNTTRSQMKMFLTRLGSRSKFVITGDITQIDLNKPAQSGLLHAMKILKTVPEIEFIVFAKQDISRHPVVEKIVAAYEAKMHSE